MKLTTIDLASLNNWQLSWLLAKHLFPRDALIARPELAVGDSGYNMIDAGQDGAELLLLSAIAKYKVSVIWRPWMGKSGQWWACVEDDPFDTDEVLGVFNDDRNRAIVLALVAHLEEARVSMKARIPEVLMLPYTGDCK